MTGCFSLVVNSAAHRRHHADLLSEVTQQFSNGSIIRKKYTSISLGSDHKHQPVDHVLALTSGCTVVDARSHRPASVAHSESDRCGFPTATSSIRSVSSGLPQLSSARHAPARSTASSSTVTSGSLCANFRTRQFVKRTIQTPPATQLASVLTAVCTSGASGVMPAIWNIATEAVDPNAATKPHTQQHNQPNSNEKGPNVDTTCVK